MNGNGILSGRSTVRVIVGTNPAAGAEIVETVPASTIWRLISISFVFLTDGTQNLRRVSLIIDAGADAEIYYPIATDFDHPLSTRLRYSLGAGVGDGIFVVSADPLTGLDIILMPLPVGLILLPGDRFRTVTNNIAALDDFDAPRFQVEEFKLAV